MKSFHDAWTASATVHPAWWAVLSFILGALAAILAGADSAIAPAVISLAGVGIGALIARGTARTGQQAQLTGSIWPQRMRAHQDAFLHWRRCSEVVHAAEDDQTPVLSAAQLWWDENCLYFSEESSEQFAKMLLRVRMHRGLVEEGRGQRDSAKAADVKENFRLIRETGRTIAAGAGRHVSDRVLAELSPEAKL